MVSAASAMNAMAHAAEALHAPDASPIVSLMAEEAVRELAGALPEVVREPGGLAARTRALYGAWLCGTCLSATTMGLHHKLCHIFGGLLNLPHAETHTVLLPHALAYNALPAVPELRRALGRDDPARALWDLSGSLGLPRSLKELGADPVHLEDVVARAVGGGSPTRVRSRRPACGSAPQRVGGASASGLMGGGVPVGAYADRDLQADGERVGGRHPVMDDLLDGVPLARRHLQDDLVVHLEQPCGCAARPR